jgi:hypothetical protein
MLAGKTSSSYADTGSVRIRIPKVGFMIGIGGDSGILHFKGKNDRLRIDGVSAGPIGVAQARTGWARPPIWGPRRTSPAAIRRHLPALQWRRQKDRTVAELEGRRFGIARTQVGFDLSLNRSGVNITLQ